MNRKLKKLASVLTSSLLAAAGLVGFTAVPAHAASPVTIWDYESSPTGAPGWANAFGYSADGNEWANIVTVGPSDMPYGSGGNKGIKATEGSGSYSGTNLGSIGATDSLLSSGSLMAIVEFYAPAAGQTVRLKVEDNGSTTSIFADANTSVVGWQTLVFNFAVPQSGSYNSAVNYNKASINYKPASTANSAADTYYIGEVVFNTLSTSFNYESTPLCATDGFASRYAFSEGNDGWASNCLAADTGAATFGVRAIKAVEGSGSYSGTNLGNIAETESLISATSKIAKVQFYAPATGQIVRLRLENTAAWPNTAAIAADATTSGTGWQTLTFDFSTPTDGTSYVAGTKYSKASISYKPASTVKNDPGDVYWVDQITFYGSTVAPLPLQEVDVRLISTLKNTATDTYQWTSCGGASWCANNNYFMKMIAAGSSTTLTYLVTEHGTNTPIAGATVNLRMNTGYSGSNATWSANGTNYAAVPSWNPNDAGVISGTSNGSGEVSFTFTNTNSSGEVARVLNATNPYPSGCFSPEGQTKAALQPDVVVLPGKLPGGQFVDVLWPHISSATINTSVARGSDGVDCNARVIVGNQKNKGEYPHLRLESSFLDTYFDASWWDGVWQNRDADTQAFLKYIPVGSTFKLTYVVTGNDNYPLANAPVSLIVNANYSCAKTFFMYENTLIGPDDCAGGGQTELPAKKTDSQGRVSFVLTNTNSVGEAMPLDLNGLPNGKVEVGTNIKPHLVGATKEGIDMLFAHFVQPTEKASVSAPAASSVAAGGNAWSTFTFTDENGAAITNTEVAFMINGFESKTGYAKTDASGKVLIRSASPTSATGQQVVAVSLIRPGKLPITGSTKVNWISPVVTLAASGAKGAVVVSVTSANGKSVKISIGGKVYTRTAASDSATFSIPATAGAKRVVVTVGTKSVTKTVTVSK